MLKLVLDRICAEYGVHVWLHSMIIGCDRDGSRVRSVEVVTRSGLRAVTGSSFIDSTGDGDLAAFAGCEFVIGSEDEGKPQPMTLSFRIGNVNADRFRSTLDLSKFENNMSLGEIDAKYLTAKKLGRIGRNPRDSLIILNHMLDSVVHFNSTRVLGKISVRANDLSEAEVEGREQVFEIYQLLRDEVAGFEDSYLLMTGPQIGVRESRRLVGAATVTIDDLLGCVRFPDSIARGTWHIELHNPNGDGIRMQRIPARRYYTVPFRSLYTPDRENLLVIGRAVSATQEAHSVFG